MLTEGVPPLKAPPGIPADRPNAASNPPGGTNKAKGASPPPKVSSIQGGRR
jgi:hypothetical protein